MTAGDVVRAGDVVPAGDVAPAGSRRLAPDARREQILAGAVRLFGERPFATVSTSELARELGVARGLINHYFGTRRGLYLEVVRRVSTIPAAAARDLPDGTRSDRAGAAVDWFLDAVVRHRALWLAVGTGGSGDAEVDAVLAEADEVAVDRVATALLDVGPDDVRHAVAPAVRAHLRSFFGLVRAASREWLVHGALDRDEVRSLLVRVLVTVVDGVDDRDLGSSHG